MSIRVAQFYQSCFGNAKIIIIPIACRRLLENEQNLQRIKITQHCNIAHVENQFLPNSSKVYRHSIQFYHSSCYKNTQVIIEKVCATIKRTKKVCLFSFSPQSMVSINNSKCGINASAISSSNEITNNNAYDNDDVLSKM